MHKPPNKAVNRAAEEAGFEIKVYWRPPGCRSRSWILRNFDRPKVFRKAILPLLLSHQPGVKIVKTLILAMAFAISASVYGAASDRTIVTSVTTKWEYKQVQWDSKMDSVTMQTELDALGDQGWELSGTIARRSPEGSDILLFKRSKDSDDVSIEFVEELDLIIVRGSKSAVEKTLSQMQAIKESAKRNAKP